MKDGERVDNIDWSGVNHGARQRKDVEEVSGGDGKSTQDDPFDTRIAGPWMKRWRVKHHNKHTEFAEKTLGDDGSIVGWH